MIRKPTRRDLLVVIGRLQDLISRSSAAHGNDRNPDGFEQGMRWLQEAFGLCVSALGQDFPIKPTGPWGPQAHPARLSRSRKVPVNETPANLMSAAAIEEELLELEKMFEQRHDGAGSPGEWMVERMGGLETELDRRARSGRKNCKG
jgi:hypothetical protein